MECLNRRRYSFGMQFCVCTLAALWLVMCTMWRVVVGVAARDYGKVSNTAAPALS